MAVPYTFGSATTSIPLSQLDSNFATTITLGNTAIQLGNTVTTLNNMTLANATVSSGNATVTTLTAPTHNSASSLTFQTNGTTTAVTVDTSQNVGIGNTAPGAKLEVTGAIRSLRTGSTAAVLQVINDNNSWNITSGTTTAQFRIDNNLLGTALTINGNSNIVLAGGTATASGVGITFPATQSASSDANCLDDYEEGTWTPTLQGSTTNPTVTYVTQTGSYTKIGNMVTVFVRLQTSAVSGGSGTALVAGLPFTANSTYRNGAAIGYFSNITLGAGNTQVGLSPDTGGVSTIRFVQSGSGIGASTILVGGIGAALDTVFTFTYSV